MKRTDSPSKMWFPVYFWISANQLSGYRESLRTKQMCAFIPSSCAVFSTEKEIRKPKEHSIVSCPTGSHGTVALISKGKNQILVEKKAKFLHLLPALSPVCLPIS